MTPDEITKVAELAKAGRALAAIILAEGTVSTVGNHVRIDFPDRIARDMAELLLDRLIAIV